MKQKYLMVIFPIVIVAVLVVSQDRADITLYGSIMLVDVI
jgi:hypothetical protein